MNKFIFLDIDGVLNNNEVDFLDESLNVVKKLVLENDAKIVMISSWQGNGTKGKRDRVSNILNSVGIDAYDFIDPNFVGEIGDVSLSYRVLGIIDYLMKNSDSSYVILDDEYHNDYKMICLNYFKPNKWEGLREKDFSKISFKNANLNTLNRVNYRYRELGEYERVTNKLVSVLKKVIEKSS